MLIKAIKNIFKRRRLAKLRKRYSSPSVPRVGGAYSVYDKVLKRYVTLNKGIESHDEIISLFPFERLEREALAKQKRDLERSRKVQAKRKERLELETRVNPETKRVFVSRKGSDDLNNPANPISPVYVDSSPSVSSCSPASSGSSFSSSSSCSGSSYSSSGSDSGSF